ncbi:MAG: hypothetical protein LUQ49_02495 [Methanomicrobiales archaeon]|nr:hypothetical protein [Methanomicrobiales archaeon]
MKVPERHLHRNHREHSDFSAEAGVKVSEDLDELVSKRLSFRTLNS